MSPRPTRIDLSLTRIGDLSGSTKNKFYKRVALEIVETGYDRKLNARCVSNANTGHPIEAFNSLTRVICKNSGE